MPAPVVDRTLAIQYGTLQLGVTTAYQIHDVYLNEGSYSTGTLSFDVFMKDTNQAALKTLTDALEAQFRAPKQDLLVTIAGTQFLNLSHANNTGMNARPSFRKMPTHASSRSRLYRCSVTWDQPADLAGKNYRLTSDVSWVTDLAGLLVLSVRASYTAGPGPTAATAKATADFATFCGGYKSTLGGTWDEVEAQEIRTDDDDKLAVATATFRQLGHAQSSQGTNDTGLAGVSYVIRTQRPQARNLQSSGAAAPVTVVVAFRATVRVAVSTNPEAYVFAQVIPYLRQLVGEASDAVGTPKLVGQDVSISVMDQKCEGTATFLVFETGLVRATMVTSDLVLVGEALVPVLDGKPFSRDVHPSPATKRRVIVYQTLELDTGGGGDLSQKAVEDAKAAAVAAGYRVQSDQATQEPVELRVPGGADTISLVDRTRTIALEYAELSDGAPAAPSVGQTVTR